MERDWSEYSTCHVTHDVVCFEGRMMRTIERLDLTNKTMMYFTSDHGGHIEDSDEQGQKGGWNGVYRGLIIHTTKLKRCKCLI